MKFPKKLNVIPTSLAGLLLMVFFLSGIIWSFVTPLGASPDEGSHVQYAAAVVQGEFSKLDDPKHIVNLPTNISEINEKELCYFIQVETPSECYIKIDSGNTDLIPTTLRVMKYPPMYYLVVGLPLHLDFSNFSWHVMRILSVLISTIIFGLALFTVRHVLDYSAMYGILLATTPLIAFLVGSVNPSSLEIVSGLSLMLILAYYPQLSKSKNWDKWKLISVTLIAVVLSIARPYSWIFAVLIIFIFYLRSVSQIHPIKLLIYFSIFSGLILFAIVVALKSGKYPFGALAPPALPHQILEAQFSTLDNYIYDSVGYFGWIMSYKGLELIHVTWIGLIILLFLWSLQYFSIRENISLLFTASFSIVLVPLAVYYVVFKAGYGYQARYAMALLSSIPILATIGNVRNLPLPSNQIKILLYFAPIAMISDWLISGLRYSHGIPFQLLSWSGKGFTMWMSSYELIFCTIAFLYYVVTFKAIIRRYSNKEFA